VYVCNHSTSLSKNFAAVEHKFGRSELAQFCLWMLSRLYSIFRFLFCLWVLSRLYSHLYLQVLRWTHTLPLLHFFKLPLLVVIYFLGC
jgi:hypothetical protein